jgi:hypothetical protein
VPASYASLHLSRQRRVLADPTPFATAARSYCLDSYERRLAGRALVPTTVSTLSSYVSKDYATYDIDPSGGVWSLPVFLDDGAPLVLRTGDRAIERPAPPDLRVVRGIAVMSADRFAVHDGVGLFLYEQSAWQQLETSGNVSEIAFAHDGTLYVGTVLDKIERIGPHGAEPRWQLTWEGDRSYWGDGPRDRAFGDLRAISVDGDRLVFFDLVNQAIRRIDARGNVSTLAGSRAGHHDGTGDQARFFWVNVTRVMPDGSILAVEGNSSKHVRLRKIVPR